MQMGLRKKATEILTFASARRRAAVLCLFVAACSSAPPRPPLAGVAVRVVATSRVPAVELEGFSGGRVEGFASGVGNTFVGCFQSIGQGACMNSGCAAAVLLLLGVCGTVSVFGGIAGAANTQGDAARQSAASGIAHALDTTPAQQRLRDRVVALARARGADWRNDNGTDGAEATGWRLEVELLRVGTYGPGDGAPSRLRMEAQVRLLGRDGGEIARRREVVDGASYSLAEWRFNRGARLLEGFDDAYERLARRIVEGWLTPA